MKGLNHIALFAGMGGFIEAANQNNFKTEWANEIEAPCLDVLSANYPQVKLNKKSIADITPQDLEHLPNRIDLLSAGFPCQSFSLANNSSPTGFSDERGELFFEIPRLIEKLKAPPRVLLLENVPSLKEYDGGSFLKIIINELRFAGYWVNEKHAQILSSRAVSGSPQDRKRIFIVAVNEDFKPTNDFDFRAIPNENPKDVFDLVDRNSDVASKYYLPDNNKYAYMIKDCAEEVGNERLFQIRRILARPCKEGICPTLTANMGSGGHNVPFVITEEGIRRLTEQECLSLQGFDPQTFSLPEDLLTKDLLKMIGNAVHVNLVSKILNAIAEQLF